MDWRSEHVTSERPGPRWRVLVFPGGTEIGMEIWRELRLAKEVTLFSAGATADDHAGLVFARHFVVPRVDETGWLEGLNRVLEGNKIDFVYPAHDDVIVALAKNADRLMARTVCAPVETCLTLRSKRATYRALMGALPIPRCFNEVESVGRFPVFVRPDRGEGSRRARVVESRDELRRILASEPDLVVTEFLPGREYTVDCFSDREKGLLFRGVRTRDRIRSGIAMRSRTVRNETIEAYADAISGVLALHGPWFFQVKEDEHRVPKLLEVGPRIAGTMGVHHVLGVNFALLGLHEQERDPIEVHGGSVEIEVDRALTNRYRHTMSFEHVYVDLDDTLIVRGELNTMLVRFLFQSVGRGRKVILVTKNRGDVGEILRGFRIAALFDDIIQIPEGDRKAKYVTEAEAIFIDDSFSERMAVENACGVRTFDAGGIEMLLDDRV